MSREYTERLLEMIEEGMLDQKQALLACLKYMSEAEVEDMMKCNEFASLDSGFDFRLDQEADICGTSLQGYVTLVPASLVRVCGRSEHTDDYKVSGQYCFKSANGAVFTLYDWKSTTLYGTEAYRGGEAMTPDEFWASEEPFIFNIGGYDKSELDDFITFLKEWIV